MLEEFVKMTVCEVFLAMDRGEWDVERVRFCLVKNVFCEIICHSVIILRKWLICRNIMG